MSQNKASISVMASQEPVSRPPNYPPQNLDARYEYYRELFRDRARPFAFIDLDLFDDNIVRIASQAGDKHIRLASKSLRSRALLQRVLAANACFQGIMCFTAREALYLAEQGFTDLLLGYPTWQEHDIAAIAQASLQDKRIVLMVDSLEQIKHTERIAQQHQAHLPLCLDIDMSLPLPGLHFGVRRSPLRTVEDVRPLVDYIKKSDHLTLDGIMGYEAQIAGLGDAFAGQGPKNVIVRLLKRRSLSDITQRRAAIVKFIREEAQLPIRIVNGGGTGSLHTTKQEAAVTEVTVGSGFYSPTLFDNFHAFRYQPAAGYAIEIVRQPRSHIYTCQGGGYTASGAVGADKQAQPYLPQGTKLDALEGAGEVQTPIHYQGKLDLHLGDPIFMRHAKAGELCERFTHLLLVQAGAIVDEVPTYRGDGQCFL
ncbi:amino acid deaminase/aldolase [Ktedonospora formicarum]|uniref:Amino acid aldolase n=1 Tax=Ktedonospora formicarum TaxID=2778364 RepID=A0A8J3HVG6_9CHLR|nr:amino acid deaminase/aldolase [Ktedonospora formicarum]GHO42721.1 amino acid aldolase [Ktedonospora formicarum]